MVEKKTNFRESEERKITFRERNEAVIGSGNDADREGEREFLVEKNFFLLFGAFENRRSKLAPNLNAIVPMALVGKNTETGRVCKMAYE